MSEQRRYLQLEDQRLADRNGVQPTIRPRASGNVRLLAASQERQSARLEDGVPEYVRP